MRSTITFKDLLHSSIAPQIRPPWYEGREIIKNVGGKFRIFLNLPQISPLPHFGKSRILFSIIPLGMMIGDCSILVTAFAFSSLACSSLRHCSAPPTGAIHLICFLHTAQEIITICIMTIMHFHHHCYYPSISIILAFLDTVFSTNLANILKSQYWYHFHTTNSSSYKTRIMTNAMILRINLFSVTVMPHLLPMLLPVAQVNLLFQILFWQLVFPFFTLSLCIALVFNDFGKKMTQPHKIIIMYPLLNLSMPCYINLFILTNNFDQISLTVSVYSTVGVAVERFISVCLPHNQVVMRSRVMVMLMMRPRLRSLRVVMGMFRIMRAVVIHSSLSPAFPRGFRQEYNIPFAFKTKISKTS